MSSGKGRSPRRQLFILRRGESVPFNGSPFQCLFGVNLPGLYWGLLNCNLSVNYPSQSAKLTALPKGRAFRTIASLLPQASHSGRGGTACRDGEGFVKNIPTNYNLNIPTARLRKIFAGCCSVERRCTKVLRATPSSKMRKFNQPNKL